MSPIQYTKDSFSLFSNMFTKYISYLSIIKNTPTIHILSSNLEIPVLG